MRKMYSKKMKVTVLVLALVFALIAGVGTGVVAENAENFTFKEALNKVDYSYSANSLNNIYSTGQAELMDAVLADRLRNGKEAVDITDVYGSKNNDSTSYSYEDLRKYASSDDAKALLTVLDSLDEDNYDSIWGHYDMESGYFYMTADDGKILYSEDYWENLDNAFSDGLDEDEGLFVVTNSNGDMEEYKFTTAGDATGDLIEISSTEACARLLGLPEDTDFSSITEEFIYGYKYARKYETISTVNGTKLWEYALKNPSVSLIDLYRNLLNSANQVVEAYSDNNGSNSLPEVYYFAKDRETGKVFTNRASWKKQDVNSLIKELDVPFVACGYYSGAETYSKLIAVSDKSVGYEAGFSEDIPSNSNGNTIGNCDVIYAMNSENPIVVPEYVNRITSWFMPALAAMVIGLLGVIITLILSLVQAGRREEDKEIVPSAYARKCPVEIMLILDAALWILGITVVCAVLDDALGIDIYGTLKVFLTGIAAVVIMVAVLFTLVPLVSKIRGRCIKDNSLLVKLCKAMGSGIRTVYRGSKPTLRAVIVIVCISVVSVLSVVLARTLVVTVILWIALIVLLMIKAVQKNKLIDGIKKISGGNLDFQIDTGKMTGDELEMANEVNKVKESMRTAVDLRMQSERMKTDLITNVSHDIKTPLTSIINYVDLIKREDIEDEKIKEYVDVLDAKAHRLKQLTDDLVEVSKTSSGSIELEVSRIDLKELIMQTQGEFYQKFTERNLNLISHMPEEEMAIDADGRRVYRILENLYSNAAKYSMPGSRVYAEGTVEDNKVVFTLRNISENELNISADELMERFVRGDVSRNTEGSGLGLEIARNLTMLMMGTLDVSIDGDLFKVTVSFPKAE